MIWKECCFYPTWLSLSLYCLDGLGTRGGLVGLVGLGGLGVLVGLGGLGALVGLVGLVD